jgi:predicted phosphodiesterase
MILVVGDLHGSWSFLKYKINCFKDQLKDSKIIIAGDCGIGFSNYNTFVIPSHLMYIDKQLRDINCDLYLIRGNHDNPKYFLPYGESGSYTNVSNDIFTNIKFVCDYDVIEHDEEKILCIGGAISIDRSSRILGSSWWEDEIITYTPEQQEKCKNITGLTRVITHNCPTFCPPEELTKTVLDWQLWENANIKFLDRNLVQELNDERKILTNVYDEIIKNNKIKSWYYGHMHISRKININGTYFIALNEEEIISIDDKKI